MKITISILSLVFPCAMLNAQSAFPALGGNVTNAHGSLSYTVGQVETHYARARVTNAETVSASLHEGVQQTYLINELDIDEANGVSARLYPNPTVNEITIEIISVPGQYTYELYTIEGKLLQQSKFVEERTTVNMSSYSSGSYLLRLYGDGRESKYRIVKIK